LGTSRTARRSIPTNDGLANFPRTSGCLSFGHADAGAIPTGAQSEQKQSGGFGSAGCRTLHAGSARSLGSKAAGAWFFGAAQAENLAYALD